MFAYGLLFVFVFTCLLFVFYICFDLCFACAMFIVVCWLCWYLCLCVIDCFGFAGFDLWMILFVFSNVVL